MPETIPTPGEPLELSPAQVLARELTRANGLGSDLDSPAAKLAAKAYGAALAGSTCAKIGLKDLSEVPKTFCAADPAKRTTPLVSRGERLYLGMMDALEESLAALIHSRLAPHSPDSKAPGAWEPNPAWLPQPRPGQPQTCADQQKAVKLACAKPLVLLTGGPGTGKTTTAACIIGAVASHLRLPVDTIRLCAPTGRATNRLDTGIRTSKVLLDHADLLGSADVAAFQRELPKALTVQKLIQKPDRLTNARLVIVDECSMVDIYQFSKLLAAIPAEARIVLIGDPQQLPPVDTGSVLRDLCDSRDLQESKAELREQFRAGSEARKWSEYALAVVAKKPAQPPGDIESKTPAEIVEAAKPRFASILEKASANELVETGQREAITTLLAECNSLRILCSHRRGPQGSAKLNELMRKALGLKAQDQAGSLVMVTRNDHKVTNLSNGEVGVVVKGGLVWFPDKPLPIPFSQLPPNEPAFATTIHKAQGSEYDEVYLVIAKNEPAADDDDTGADTFLNRQLVFTGLTRAIKSIRVFGDRDGLEAALMQPAERASGLAERLGGEVG